MTILNFSNSLMGTFRQFQIRLLQRLVFFLQLCNAIVGKQLPMAYDSYLIAYLGNLSQLMRGEENRLLLAYSLDYLPEFHHPPGIESQCWLVQDQYRGVVKQGLR